MNVEVILIQDDPKLGQKGQVVRVAPGYAHNYLIPYKKALLATSGSLESFENERKKALREKVQQKAKAEETQKKLAGVSVTLEKLTGANDKLHGAITSKDIAEALAKQNIFVDRKDIHLAEPIHRLGTYRIPVKLHPEVGAELKVWVIKAKK